MGDDRFSFPACVIAGKRRLDVDDLLMLRKHAFSDGIRTEGDVRLILAIHRACASSCPQWDSYVIESIATYAVHRLAPRGWLDESNAEWLAATLSVEGVVRTPLELEILLHALDMTASAPNQLYALALEQMYVGLLPGSRNAYALSRPGRHPGVDLADLHYLWRVLRSACEDGRLHMSAAERDILQAIDALAQPADHHDGWNSLVGMLKLRSSGTVVKNRARWLKASDESLVGTASRSAFCAA